MIYLCLTTRNHRATAGLVLWKIRQVFEDVPREYQILVMDDASTDETAEALMTYQRALPMTVFRHEQPRGHAACLERLLREALGRTDHPRRDLAVTLPADFSASPAVLPDIARRFESGADLVVGEGTDVDRSLGMRLVRRSAPWLLRPGLSIPGIKDPTSGVCAVRLITLKKALEHATDRFLESDGLSANAELVARVARQARQVSSVTLPPPHHALRASPPEGALHAAVRLFRTGRRLRIPVPVGDRRTE